MLQWYRRVISGEEVGIFPACFRALARVACWGYGAAIALRNAAYDHRWLPITRLEVPVISIGNLTTGGTGKTPTVIWLARELQLLGRRPAILTRGYGASAGQVADEVQVLRRQCPDVPVIVNANRVAGGREAIRKHSADVLILDDGFQHRRLARDLDIVLVDATEPMGIPGLFPRGTWREPPTSLSRADMIMLTRCEQVTTKLADLASDLLAEWVVARQIYQQTTQVTGVVDETGKAVEVAGQKVAVFAGIGNPEGFLNTVRTLGLNVSAACWFPDHYRYRGREDFSPLIKASHPARELQAWVTTQKDWVKLQELPGLALPCPIWQVGIESQLRGLSAELFRQSLRERLGK